MNNKAKLLTIKQASKIVEGITEYRIRQMCISGELPCFKADRWEQGTDHSHLL